MVNGKFVNGNLTLKSGIDYGFWKPLPTNYSKALEPMAPALPIHDLRFTIYYFN